MLIGIFHLGPHYTLQLKEILLNWLISWFNLVQTQILQTSLEGKMSLDCKKLSWCNIIKTAAGHHYTWHFKMVQSNWQRTWSELVLILTQKMSREGKHYISFAIVQIRQSIVNNFFEGHYCTLQLKMVTQVWYWTLFKLVQIWIPKMQKEGTKTF